MTTPRAAQERAFLQSVLYASLFDYPLTTAQLRAGLIGEQADEATLVEWYERSALLQSAIEFRDGCFFPRGQTNLLETRRRREAVSRQLLNELARPLRLVTAMPFVRMVALSGSLAHLNADGGADLDLFVITAPRRVWSVTVTVLVLARLLGWRRRVCLNYVISESDLRVSPADLFSANQIVHLQPIVGHDVYSRFLDVNRFVWRFYPNFVARSCGQDGEPLDDERGERRAGILEQVLDWSLAPLYERACRALYGWHLRRRAHTWASRDQVRLERECLKLHTSSHRKEVMDRFDRAVLDALSAAPLEKAATETQRHGGLSHERHDEHETVS